MRLKIKLFLVSGITLILLLLSFTNETIRSSFLLTGLITSLISITSVLCTYFLIIKRIEQVNFAIKNDNLEQSEGLMDDQPADEIKELTQTMREMQQQIARERQLFEKYKEEKNLTLERENVELKQELASYVFTSQKTPLESTVKKLAQYDESTALPNRVFFNEILNKTINHARRHNKTFAILLVDIDKFKNIFDKFGEKNANLILKELSQRFEQTLRGDDVIAKLEGDEYIILLNDIGKPKYSSSVAEKLLKACSLPIKIDSEVFSLTASIGICVFPNDGVTLDAMLSASDAALVKAKKISNCYQFFKQEMSIEAQEYIQLDKDIRQAITNDEFILYYQPRVNLKAGNIVGLEALIRWNHPKFGLISPNQFLEHAEEMGLLMQIGEWAIHEACQTNKFWQDEGYEHLSISINVSTKQFYHEDLSQMISRTIRNTGLNPKYLQLEINESTIMDDIDAATTILNNLKDLGIQISLDHFGTAYTAISHLKLLPINQVNIDQSFIKGIPHNPNDVMITNAFIALLHNLGLEVVAEGVETAEQMQYLATQHCDIIQGYFLSHPTSATKIITQLKKLKAEVPI